MRNNKDILESALFTDFYQLTMAQLYFFSGIAETPAQFDYFFRHYPDYGEHKAGYCILAGLEPFIDWLKEARFTKEHVALLKDQKSRSGSPLFKEEFLEWLYDIGKLDKVSIKAVPEGRVVHPGTPLAVIQGPMAVAQLLESSLLNHMNFQTLIATKAARIKYAGNSNLMIEFGMRRAQGKGANAGVRAALIGGIDFSSNTAASLSLGVPPKGTHAHSMVQAFMALGRSELDSFRAYAEIYPDDCILLVDTINTLDSGVPNAIKVFEELRKKGHKPAGIRLDSGDLAYLSIKTSQMLDKAGFSDVPIVLSNQLDEMVIWQILTQIRKEAPSFGVDPDKIIARLIYGVGTRLITSKGQSALDGVYKLSAMKRSEEWAPAIKLSETPEKVINPGLKGLWRIYDKRGIAIDDLIGLEEEQPSTQEKIEAFHPMDQGISRIIKKEDIEKIEPMHQTIIRNGKAVYDFPPLEKIRQVRSGDIKDLDAGVKRLVNPHVYHVSLSRELLLLKERLVSSRKKA
jgi:nicotinate phosphoribosyltransferase